MSAPARGWRRWLAVAGIDPALPWPQRLAVVILRPPAAAGLGALAGLFPQVDFRHPRLTDPLRILVQLLWLGLARPPDRASHGPARWRTLLAIALTRLARGWSRLETALGNQPSRLRRLA
ncbi:MAG: hypothetical protein ACM3VY_00630, partial [Candidatus Bathyarchaeota archaeon]